uniref:Uncharacterized protein n=1 Tax=Paenibacillus athensensis TaxID=1967502 RepID=A0A4Y8Q5J7_9BACL
MPAGAGLFFCMERDALHLTVYCGKALKQVVQWCKREVRPAGEGDKTVRLETRLRRDMNK